MLDQEDRDPALLLHGPQACGEVGGLVVAGLEGPLGLLARLVGTLEVDVGGEVGRLRHHDHLVGADLEEAAAKAAEAAGLPDPGKAAVKPVKKKGPAVAKSVASDWSTQLRSTTSRSSPLATAPPAAKPKLSSAPSACRLQSPS